MINSHCSPTQLGAFVAVVEHRSFTVAAEALGITQSGVSRAIAALEADLGVALVERLRDGVVPTAAGEQVLPHARGALELLERIRDEANALRGLLAGRVRIGTFPSVSARLLPPLLAAFSRRHPQIELILLEGSVQEVRDWIAAGVVDLGFVTAPDPSLEVLPLLDDELLAVIPVGHHLAREPSLSVALLASEPFVMSTTGCEPLVRATFTAAGAQPNVAFEVSDAETIVAMVREGMGVTIVPALVLPRSLDGLAVLSLEPITHRQLGLAHCAQCTCAPGTRAFLEFVAERTRQTS